ncbi:hypothetical protein MBLNU457_4980t1 [Dothideomycetes sp. NU457]
MAPSTISLYPAPTTVKHPYVKPDLRINTSKKGNNFPPRSSSLTATMGKVMNGAAVQVTCQQASPEKRRAVSMNHNRASLPPPPPLPPKGLSDHEIPPSVCDPLVVASVTEMDTTKAGPSHRKNSARSASSTGSLRRRNANRRSSSYGQPPSRAGSPTPHLNTIDASREQKPIDDVPIRSIFPMYQPELPLSQQPYYPQTHVTPQLPSRHFSKGLELASSFPLSTETAPENLAPVIKNDVPWANDSDLYTLYEIANGERFEQCRTDRLRLVVSLEVSDATAGSKSPATTINIGSSSGTTLYSASLPSSVRANHPTSIKVQRFHPREQGTFPVADMVFAPAALETVVDDKPPGNEQVTTIFPQIAALSAIKHVANSLQAREIARFDPNASSIEAAQLALDAVGMAKEREDSLLTYQRTDSFFELRHPQVGSLSVVPSSDIDIFDSLSATGGVSIYPPESKNKDCTSALATLDLTNGYLELDTASLFSSRSRYMTDTVICTLVSAAFHASKQLMQKVGLAHFAAPPKTPTPVSKRGFRTPTILSRSSSVSSFKTKLSARSSKRESKAKAKKKKREENASRLPPITRGILHLLGFTFDAIVWLLSLGVKVLTKLVVCLSGKVEKS